MWHRILACSLLLVGCADVSPRAEPPPRWRYVALGDSVAAGSGSATSYPAELAQRIRAAGVARVRLVDQAVGGTESDELLRDLRRDRALRADVRGADLVTVTVGANDLVALHHRYRAGDCGGPDNLDCYREEVDAFVPRWEAILDEILELQAKPGALLRVTNYYDPYLGNEDLVREDLGDGYPEEARLIAIAHNRAICDVAASRSVPCADVYGAFNGPDGTRSPRAAGLLAEDGFHPSEAGHRRIADLLHALGYGPA